MKIAAAALVLCVSCASTMPNMGAPAPERWRVELPSYYEDEPQAAKLVGGVMLTCAVVVGFVVAWPEIEYLFTDQLSLWWYGY